MLQEEHVVWLLGWSLQAHVRFVWCAIAFSVVALHARRSKILPCVVTTTRAGDDVVDCERGMRCAAIVAAHAIATQDVFA